LGVILYISNVFAQVITSGQEESVVYMQLSDILDNTQKYLDDLVQSINSGEKDNALNIISNITTNIKKIENGLDLIGTNPIYGRLDIVIYLLDKIYFYFNLLLEYLFLIIMKVK